MMFYDCNQNVLIPELQQIIYTDLRSAHFIQVQGFEISKSGIAYAEIFIPGLSKFLKIKARDSEFIFENLIIIAEMKGCITQDTPVVVDRYEVLDPDILLREIKDGFNKLNKNISGYFYRKNGIRLFYYASAKQINIYLGFRHLKRSLGINTVKELEQLL